METNLFDGLWETHARALRTEEGPKPTALGTLLRVSDAGSCLRQRSLYALGVPESEEIDSGTLLAFSLGQAIHDQLQAAMMRAYPDGLIEEKMDLRPWGVDLSGHCDGIMEAEDPEDVTVVAEFKSVGAYAAKLAWADGPKVEHIAQAALYALSIEAEAIHIAYVAKEKDFRTGISPGDMREWTFMMDEPVEEGGPTPTDIAEIELDRFKKVAGHLAEGRLPPALIPDDDNRLKMEKFPGPFGVASKSSSWQCRYCRHNSTCVSLGPEVQDIPVHLLPKEAA